MNEWNVFDQSLKICFSYFNCFLFILFLDYTRAIMPRVIHLCQAGDKTTTVDYRQLACNPGSFVKEC